MNTSFDILWYGRGGQGAFSAAKLLGASYAFSASNRHAMAFPSFGPERRGAPVRAFTKLSDKPVNDRSAITIPDFAVCLDQTLLSDFLGMQIKEGGFVLTTTPQIEQFATEYLGRAIVNTVLVAVLCATTGLLTADDICRGIEETLPARIQKKNIELVQAAFGRAHAFAEMAVLDPSPEEPGQQAAQQHPNRAANPQFEYMNLRTADAFAAKTQHIYRPPGGDAQ